LLIYALDTEEVERAVKALAEVSLTDKHPKMVGDSAALSETHTFATA